jgi:putative ABC transport system substrate-binding protein
MAIATGRRQFISTIAGAAAVWPLGARAQQPALPVVGFLRLGSADSNARNVAAFRKGLNETGYVEGQNVTVEYHYLEGQYDRVPALVADLVRRQVAVIATPGADGNVTGINFFPSEVAAKRLRLLHDLVPKAARIAVLVNPDNTTTAEATLREVQQAAPAIGLQLQILNATTSSDIDAAFAAMARDHAEALFVAPDAFFTSRRGQFVTLTARDKIPAAYGVRDVVEAGGLMSYGTDLADMFQQVGVYTGRVLKGAKPADLPVTQLTKFEFVINLQTARALGIEVPPGVLSIADEVIE